MLNVKYSTSMVREFCALYFGDLFSRLPVLSFRRKMLETNTWRYFWVHFGKSCFQRLNLLYKSFIVIASDVGSDSGKNGIIVKLKTKMFRICQVKKKQ
jgi:hypothetical protein